MRYVHIFNTEFFKAMNTKRPMMNMAGFAQFKHGESAADFKQKLSQNMGLRMRTIYTIYLLLEQFKLGSSDNRLK